MNCPNIYFLETRGILNPVVLESLLRRVIDTIRRYNSDLTAIASAASLAHHGLIGSVKEVVLRDVDLTSVPAEHLTSLVSSVTERVTIEYVSGCDLVTFLDNVRSKLLEIRSQSLGIEETRALVRAMESRVEKVELRAAVTLNISMQATVTACKLL